MNYTTFLLKYSKKNDNLLYFYAKILSTNEGGLYMKKEKYEFVQRIQNHYVGDDCLQIMVSHKLNSGFTMLNADGMTYHYRPNSYLFVNKYTSDERKNQFPYSQIPNHKSRVGFKKLEYVNQLLDFNKVYIEIKDGIIIETFAVKDNNEGLVATKLIVPNNESTKYMNRSEVIELLKSGNVGLFSFDGGYYNGGLNLISEESILEWYKQQLIERRKEEENYYDDNGTSKDLSDLFRKSIGNLTINDVPSDIILHDDYIIVISSENNEIKSVKAIQIRFMSTDNYKIISYEFPITIYSLEHITKLEQTNSRKTSEPKFPKGLNKAIDKNDIKQSKQLVLSRKKKNN